MSTHDNRKPLLRILGFAGIAGAGIAIAAVAYQQGQAAHERLIGQAYIQGRSQHIRQRQPRLAERLELADAANNANRLR